ncbi:type II CAAX prenyl endopeptidase Rce1 family protein [Ekhidna sp.]|uniref:CPBP family glutamic-type intramembrane protease n=1 Tax=Ekhidna sp. TaxID=2608089 RepID=UPI003B598F75
MKKPTKIFILIVVLTVLLEKSYTFIIITYLDNPALPQTLAFSEMSEFSFIFAALILGPIVETAVFQAFIIEFCLALSTKKGPLIISIAILASTFLFALSHSYSDDFMVIMIFPGMLFTLTYMVSKKFSLNAFLVTLTSHSLANGVSLLINRLS